MKIKLGDWVYHKELEIIFKVEDAEIRKGDFQSSFSCNGLWEFHREEDLVKLDDSLINNILNEIKK